MTEHEDLQASLVAATIDEVYESGYAAASLSSIAQRAGVDENVVEQHYPDLSTLVTVTMGWMYGDLGYYVGSRIEEASDGLGRIQAYIRAMVRYFYDNPKHVRVMGEVIGSGDLGGEPGDRTRERRWQALADLMSDGQRNGLLGDFDPRAVAIIVGGSIDGLIVEWTADSTFDLLAAAEALVDLVSTLTRGAAFAP